MKKNTRWILITITLLITCAAMTSMGQTSSPIIAVDPSVVEDLDPGQTFDINITVANVTDLYGWSLNLTFNPGVLNVEKVTEGPFLKEVHNTIILPPNIDNTVGFVFAGGMFIPPLPENGANGSGVLATITFEVKGSGETSLHFEVSKLNTVISGNNKPIPHTSTDGLFRNAAPTIFSLEMIVAIIAVVAVGGIIAVILYRRRTAEA